MPSGYSEFEPRFRARLRLLRQEQGLRQQDLESADLSEGVYRQVELGIREPRLSTVYAIARAFGIPLHELLDVRGVDPKAALPRRGGARRKGEPASRVASPRRGS